MIRRIGIDPDTDKSGVATMENGKYVTLECLTLSELIDLFQKHSKDKNTVFVVEDVLAHKPTFRRGDHSQAVRNNISQKVGMVKASCKMIVSMLEQYQCNYEMCRPLKGFAKKAKTNAEFFNRITGWTGKTNSDKRDAAMLIYKYRSR